MGCGEHVVAAAVDEAGFAYGVAAPEEKHDAAAMLREGADGGVGEGLPAFVLVRAGLMGAHGEGGVEQQHPLVGPALQIAVGGWYVGAEVGVYLFNYVHQRRRHGYAVGHGKAEAHGLPRLVIGILAENDDLHLVERGAVEGGEDVGTFGIAGIVGAVFDEESFQLRKIGCVELGLQDSKPRRVNLYQGLEGGRVGGFKGVVMLNVEVLWCEVRKPMNS